MSNGAGDAGGAGELSHEELMSALFANLVVQQTNMAFVLLGKVAHPDTGERIQDLETAKMFIDQLEMLAVKTRGNLAPDEDHLLKQSLMNLRMGFVETLEQRGKGSAPRIATDLSQNPAQPKITPTAPDASAASHSATASTSADEESKKRFTKKYQG